MLGCWGWKEVDISCGSQSGKGGEVCEESRNRMNDVCCL